MPIKLNPQNCIYTDYSNFARTFSYEGLKPDMSGDVKAELRDISTLLKTPTRFNNLVEVRLYIGPFQHLKSPEQLNIKWNTSSNYLPAIYRKFELLNRIKLATGLSPVQKILSTKKELTVSRVKIIHGRIIIGLKISTTVIYSSKR